MNSDTVLQLLQRGFRVTLGATASLVEILQDPQRRDANLSKLRTELDQLAQEWAEKGSVTEQEARNFVDTILHQGNRSTPSPTESSGYDYGSTTTVAAPPSPASPDTQLELQELTAQLAAIRAELEALRNQESDSGQ